MDNLLSRDDTLEEVHYQIKKECHSQIKYLASITGLAILCCLVLIWSNQSEFPYKNFLYVLTDILILITVIFGIKIIVSIIDPDRIELTANELLGEKKEFEPDEAGLDEGLFIKEFIILEKNTRNMIKRYEIPIRVRYTEVYSFRQMIDSLMKVGIINKLEYKRLLRVSEYRNLIVHGHQEKVNQKMYDEVKNLQKVIDKANKKLEEKRLSEN